MADLKTRLEVFSDLLFSAGNLYFWCYSSAMELKYTSCDDDYFWYNLFHLAEHQEQVLKHMQISNKPLLLTSAFHLLWIAIPATEHNETCEIYLIGPVLPSGTADNQLINEFDKMNLSVAGRQKLLAKLKLLPVMPTLTLVQYSNMFYYCIYQTRIDMSDTILTEIPDASYKPDPNLLQENSHHGSWALEQQMMTNIENGALLYDNSQLAHPPKPGAMAINDPLRQSKNEMIVYAALCTRAAIRGGYPSENAYSLSDLYIQAIEVSNNIPDAVSYGSIMYRDFLERVRQAKKKEHYSRYVNTCITYIDSRIFTKISLKELAHELGYTEYYLSSQFKKETGKNIKAYILEEKIEQAKFLLKNSRHTILEISELLHFTSPSYFISLFKKIIGMTPRQYQNLYDHFI